jgi:toxin FitB
VISILLDTNVVSELMKPQPDIAVKHWFSQLEDTALVTTSITVAEITFGLAKLPAGARRSRLQASFTSWVGAMGVLPVLAFDDVASRAAGDVRAFRHQNGLATTFADSAIAGIALSTQSLLATRNVRDFEGFGLEVIDPWT